jgi:hypothetical protein
MNASSRDEVFAELRKRGIKAIKVVAADGSKANGEMRGVRKRVVFVAIVCVAVIVGSVAYFTGARKGEHEAVAQFQEDQTRRQIIGDVAVIEKGILTGWSDVFELEGDRFLASFAIPGVRPGQRNTNEESFMQALNSRQEIMASDSLEVRQIKAMVEGMKDEARAYLLAGGTVVEYGKRLTERQDAEIAIYERAKAELKRAKETMTSDRYLDLWEERNNQLRNLGIKLLLID